MSPGRAPPDRINQHSRLTSTVEAMLAPDTRALLDTLWRQESAGEKQCGLQTDLDEGAVAVDQTGETQQIGVVAKNRDLIKLLELSLEGKR